MISIFRCLIELETPLHCGGGENNGFDQPVIRDGYGLYRIPGSSIAGILRASAVQAGTPAALVDRAFGFIEHGKAEGKASGSCIWCQDALLLDLDNTLAVAKAMKGDQVSPVFSGIYIRDHVRLDLEKGAAIQGGKFDEEFAPAGCRFVMEIRLDGWTGPVQKEMQELFVSLCSSVRHGAIRFGGKAAEGFGRIRCLDASLRSYDLTDAQQMEAWLNLPSLPYENKQLFPASSGKEVTLPALTLHRGNAEKNLIDSWVRANLEAAGPLLVGGGSRAVSQAEKVDSNEKQADMLFYMEPYLDYEKKTARWKRVVPGSSLRGVLRQRVYAIALVLFGRKERAEAVLDSIFGCVKADQTRPGKIAVQDAPLPEAKPTLVQHVAIDRFTGGALDGALFAEAPVWKDKMRLPFYLHIHGLAPAEGALLLHALMDLAEGFLPVGGGTNRGNGVLLLTGLGAGPEKKWQDALKQLEFSFNWQGKTLNRENAQEAQNWLERLDTELHAAQEVQ